MATPLKMKRSAVASKTPLTTDLELGELAVNTYDGKLFLKKDDGAEAIVEVGNVPHTHTKSDITDFSDSDYATAAQGSTADSAVQPGDNISTLTNDSGFTTNTGDITGVTAGDGLTGGGSSGGVTLDVDIATAANIREGEPDKVLTADGVESACEPVTISGTSNWTPDWSAFIVADWEVTANRTINNPTNVEPGTTRLVEISGSTSTDRTISWGSNYVGNIPDGIVDSTTYWLVSLTAFSTSEIFVSFVEEAP